MVFLHSPNILSSTHPLQVLSYPVLKRLQESTPNTKSLPEKMQIEQTQSHNLFTEFYGIFSPPLICLLSDPLSVLISSPPPPSHPACNVQFHKISIPFPRKNFFPRCPTPGCYRTQSLLWKECGYFLELHNKKAVYLVTIFMILEARVVV